MKIFYILLISVLIGFANLKSYSQTITYDYDASGNRVERVIVLEKGKKINQDSEESEKKEVVLDDSFDEGTLKIYPNPTKGLLKLEIPTTWTEDAPVRIMVFSMNGAKLIDENVSSYQWDVDLSRFQNGMYILNILRGNIISRWKIIKQ